MDSLALRLIREATRTSAQRTEPGRVHSKISTCDRRAVVSLRMLARRRLPQLTATSSLEQRRPALLAAQAQHGSNSLTRAHLAIARRPALTDAGAQAATP